MLIWLIRKLLKRLRPKPTGASPVEAPRSSTYRKPRREWEKELLVSFEVNNLAPSEEVILYAFDKFKEDLYAPVMERRLALANLHAEIVAIVASLQALVPGLIVQVIGRHPFEFPHIIEHREDD